MDADLRAASAVGAPLFQHWREFGADEAAGVLPPDAALPLQAPDASDPYGFTAFLLPMAELEAAARGGSARDDDDRPAVAAGGGDVERAAAAAAGGGGAPDDAASFLASLRPRIGVAGVLRRRSTKWRAEVLARPPAEAPRATRFVAVAIPESFGLREGAAPKR